MRAPQIYNDQWYQCTVVGVSSAAVALASVWIVCGRARWWVRMLATPLLVIILALAIQVLFWCGHIVWRVPREKLNEYIQFTLRDIWGVTEYWSKSIGLGLAVLCVWLVIIRRAGWFAPFDELSTSPEAKSVAPWQAGDRGTALARWAAAGVFVLVALFPLALLYRLLMPPPFPIISVPQPNGFDDLVAAGKMLGEAAGSRLEQWSNLTDAQLQSRLAGSEAAFERMRRGLERPCVNPHVRDWPAAYFQPLITFAGARAEMARRTGTLDERLTAYWDYLRVSHEATRGTGVHWYSGYASGESSSISGLWDVRKKLSAPQCIDLAAKLSKFDSRRQSWEGQRAQQRIFDANRDWKSHLPVILADWSGTDLYKDIQGHQQYFSSIIQLRMLILELGLRAHQLDHGSLPTNLEELVPAYLPAVPQDPYGDDPLNYRLTGERYTIYSLGIDRDDDGGKPPVDTSDGDFTIDFEFPPRVRTYVGPRIAPTAPSTVKGLR
jgi:hypothetical protein